MSTWVPAGITSAGFSGCVSEDGSAEDCDGWTFSVAAGAASGVCAIAGAVMESRANTKEINCLMRFTPKFVI